MTNMKITLLALFVISGTWAADLRSNWKIGQPVSTSSGHVIGGRASVGSEVSGYFGIPYAKPPVGNLRFAPPERFEGKETINATSFVSAAQVKFTVV
jgi:cholinesterase